MKFFSANVLVEVCCTANTETEAREKVFNKIHTCLGSNTSVQSIDLTVIRRAMPDGRLVEEWEDDQLTVGEYEDDGSG